MAATVPAVKAALLDALKARPGLDGVDVEWTPTPTLGREAIFYFPKLDGTQVAVVFGNGSRDERYGLEVVASVKHRGADAQAAEERAWAIAAEVEAQVRESWTIDGLVLVAQIEGMEFQAFTGPQEVAAEVTVTIAVRARV